MHTQGLMDDRAGPISEWNRYASSKASYILDHYGFAMTGFDYIKSIFSIAPAVSELKTHSPSPPTTHPLSTNNHATICILYVCCRTFTLSGGRIPSLCL